MNNINYNKEIEISVSDLSDQLSDEALDRISINIIPTFLCASN